MEAHDHWQTGTYWAVSLGKFKCLVFSTGWSIKRFARWVLLTLAVRLFLQLLSKFPGSNFQVASGSQSSFESREHSIHGLLADRCEGNRYVEVNGRYFCQLCNAHLNLCPKAGAPLAQLHELHLEVALMS